MKPLRLEMKLRNNVLIWLREQRGWLPPQAASEIGVSYNTYIKLEGMHRRPYGRRCVKNTSPGHRVYVLDWTPTAKKIAAFYAMREEDLFPQAVLAVERSRATVLLTAGDVESLLSGNGPPQPEEWLDAHKVKGLIADAVNLLSPRERTVIRQRFGLDGEDERTLDEIGVSFGVQRERIRQIEAKAMRKLRHPSRSRALRGVVDASNP